MREALNKSSQPKPFKYRTHYPLFGAFRLLIMKPFYRKPKMTFVCDIAEPAIFVSNHDAKRGPVTSEAWFPVRTAKWGAYEMLCGYNSRRKYLRDVFYIKKQGMSRAKASFKAFFEAFFSLYIYRGMNMMPTYTDARLAKTISDSVEVLKDSVSVWIFPEDSDGGYCEEPKKFFPGFVMLAESFYRKTGKDIPVYPVYYHSGYNKLVVGKPRYAHAMKESGMDRKAIAEALRCDVVALYREYIVKHD